MARSPRDERRVSLDDGLREADFVSVHTPLTAETRHLIGARELALMKPTAVLVNTARGPVVDEGALVEALHEELPSLSAEHLVVLLEPDPSGGTA